MSPSTKEYSDRKYKNNVCCKNQRLRFALDIVRLTVLLCELTVKFITTAVSIPVNHALLMPNDTTEQQNNFTSSYLVNSKKSRITSKKITNAENVRPDIVQSLLLYHTQQIRTTRILTLILAQQFTSFS